MKYRLFFRKGNRIAVVKCKAFQRNKCVGEMIRQGYTFCKMTGGK